MEGRFAIDDILLLELRQAGLASQPVEVDGTAEANLPMLNIRPTSQHSPHSEDNLPPNEIHRSPARSPVVSLRTSILPAALGDYEQAWEW
jgi:hypothetical protein